MVLTQHSPDAPTLCLNSRSIRRLSSALAAVVFMLCMLLTPALAHAAEPVTTTPAPAQAAHKVGGEANLVLPRVGEVSFFHGAIAGDKLLFLGLIVSDAKETEPEGEEG